jgi:signal transduction histidine kinase
MRFRSQLAIGYTALLVVLIVTGTAAVIALRVSTSHLDDVTHDLRTDLTAVQWLRFEARQVVSASRSFLLGRDAKSEQRFNDATARLEATLAELDGTLVMRATDIEADVRRYVATARLAAAERGSGHTADTDPMLDIRLVTARDRLETTIDRFVQRQRAAFQSESEHVHDEADRMEGLVILATGIGVCLSLALAWLLIRRLGHQYALEREATAVARRAVEARDEMLAVVSHDLRNPLTTITIASHLLQHEPPPPHARKHATSIANAARCMDHLISELLDVAKLDAGKLELHVETCSVGSLFDAIMSLFQVRATEAGIELGMTGDGALAVTADRERVLQVLCNLVDNAFKYTACGGRVTLAAHASAATVRVEVVDTGTGIAAEQLPHVFERLWQAGVRGRGGLGLGLYICEQLIAAHHGRMGVESKLGAGSTFWFELRCPGPRAGT